MKPIITPEELIILLKETGIVLIDAGSGKEARLRYENEHLESAIYVDLNEHLAELPENAAIGGRHPLPAPEKFSALLGGLGVDADSHVVVYDDKRGNNAAARLWWMFRAAGHTKVQVLSGGLQAAKASGMKVTSGMFSFALKKLYPFTAWQLPTKNIDEVKEASESDDWLIIDVRDTQRFLGITEPLDPVAGHIQGAVNIPFKSNLDDNGDFLPTDILRKKYLPTFQKYGVENIIVHCGSGVTACHTLLAIAHAGLEIPSLYVGSWSEWCRNF